MTSGTALVRSSHGDQSEATLRNVSTFGCSLNCESSWLRSGIFISIVLADDWTVHALLRWVRGGQAGAEFLRPISQDDLAAILGSD